jgi:hypothetical protein
LIKSILDKQPKELNFLLAFVLEHEIGSYKVKGGTAVVTVNFINLRKQKLYLEKIDGEWLVNYSKFNNDFNSNLLKSTAKLLLKLLLLPIW